MKRKKEHSIVLSLIAPTPFFSRTWFFSDLELCHLIFTSFVSKLSFFVVIFPNIDSKDNLISSDFEAHRPTGRQTCSSIEFHLELYFTFLVLGPEHAYLAEIAYVKSCSLLCPKLWGLSSLHGDIKILSWWLDKRTIQSYVCRAS